MTDYFNLNKEPDFELGEVILIDKPYSWTSFDVVNKVRYKLREYTRNKKIKVGHAGTLDPLATGLLILCTGKSTKLIEEFQDGIKAYEAEFCLGATTPSFDMETKIDHTYDYSNVSEIQIREVLTEMCGPQMQTPPIYSAIQVDGKRAYQYARKGKDVKLKERQITIYNIDINKIELPIVNVTITCSKGTYIRTIADDFGKKLNNGAYLSSLRRIKSGEAHIENAVNLDAFIEHIDNLKQQRISSLKNNNTNEVITI